MIRLVVWRMVPEVRALGLSRWLQLRASSKQVFGAGGLAIQQALIFFLGRRMKYRCEATSVTGFIQILASNYLPHGYWFYVTGRVPAGKDPRQVDEKILSKYGIALSRQQRARRKLTGQANLHYVRYHHFFVILATHGKHEFFAEEGRSVRDIRQSPLQFAGYSIWVKRGNFLKRESDDELPTPDHRHRVRVLIGRDKYREVHSHLLDVATHRTADKLRWAFWNVPFEPYAPVRKQLLRILRQVNARRQAMGYERLPADALRLRRRIVKPFDSGELATVSVPAAVVRDDAPGSVVY